LAVWESWPAVSGAVNCNLNTGTPVIKRVVVHVGNPLNKKRLRLDRSDNVAVNYAASGQRSCLFIWNCPAAYFCQKIGGFGYFAASVLLGQWGVFWA